MLVVVLVFVLVLVVFVLVVFVFVVVAVLVVLVVVVVVAVVAVVAAFAAVAAFALVFVFVAGVVVMLGEFSNVHQTDKGCPCRSWQVPEAMILQLVGYSREIVQPFASRLEIGSLSLILRILLQ